MVVIRLTNNFRSEERDMALQLCSWRFDSQSLVAFLDRLEAEGSYTRAAAIAVFNLKLRLAIDILNRGALQLKDPKLSIIAMALSGMASFTQVFYEIFVNLVVYYGLSMDLFMIILS